MTVMTYDPFLDQVATYLAVEWLANNGRTAIKDATRSINDITASVMSFCEHKDSKLVKRVCVNGVFQYYRWCSMCGNKTGAIKHASLTDQERDSAALVGDWEDWQVMYPRNEIHALVQEQFIGAGIQIEYVSYLDSRGWRDIRHEVLQLDDGKCQKCGSTKNLECHHLHYMRLGDELPEDLVMLCRDCHVKVTEESIYIRGPLANSFEIVKTAHHYKNARRKHQHYESLKAKLQTLGLMPDDYQRRIHELSNAMEI